MDQFTISARHLALPRVAVLALVASLMPLGIAFAQSTRLVRVARDGTVIRSNQHTNGDVVMSAPGGAVFEVIHTEGDRFTHRKSNWYWVLLPRDAWGTQRAGWISGRQVEEVLRDPSTATATNAAREPMPSAQIVLTSATNPGSRLADASTTPAPASTAEPTEAEEVVLNFEFAKSDLTDEARGKLSDAVSHLKPHVPLSFAVEGHADAIGSEAFNKRLGLERAETVRRFLAEHEVPASQIGVISYGENQPAAPNSTELGRAQNRRVVIKVGR